MKNGSAVLTILGAGTLMPDAARHSAAHHVASSRASVLLDCGPGTAHGFAEHDVGWRDLTHVVISHYHNDHVGDLPALLFAMKHAVGADRTEPLTLLGPVGFRGFLERLAGALGDHVLDPGFELRIVEMDTARPFEEPSADLEIGCCPTPHTTESLAYRVEGGWGSVGYTGDTGPSEEVAAFLEGCDALVAECTVPDAMAIDTHLSPASLTGLATVARPGLLVVVHVSPFHAPEDAVRRIAAAYDGRVVAGVDGLRVELTEDGPAVDPHPSTV